MIFVDDGGKEPDEQRNFVLNLVTTGFEGEQDGLQAGGALKVVGCNVVEVDQQVAEVGLEGCEALGDVDQAGE